MIPINSENATVTSKYGNREYTYNGKRVKDFHSGVDLIATPRIENPEILAIEDGVVTDLVKTGEQYGRACFVRIKHDGGMYSLYYHLKSGSICVSKGAEVKRGQKIGIMGATGLATGVHLHFQVDRGSNDTSIDPTDYVFKDKRLVVVSQSSNTNYKCLFNMNIRLNAGVKCARKLVSQMSLDGQRNATSTNPNAFAVYKAGTVFTAIEIINKGSEVWAKTPSGYICLKDATTTYCEPC